MRGPRGIRARVAIGVAAVACAWISALPVEAAGAEPRIRAERDTLDLGLVVRGDVREAEFVLHNDGTAPLVIGSVDSGCGCTVVDYDRRIPPGGRGVLRATVDSNKFTGALTRPIVVYSNDPARPATPLFLKAVILGSVEVFPPELKLSNVPDEGPREETLLVRKEFSERGELQIAGAAVDAPWVTVRAERLTERRSFGSRPVPPGRPGDWLLHVRLEPTHRHGVTEHVLRFATGLPREPEIEVPVFTIVRTPVNLSAERLKLEPREGGRSRGATLFATVRRGLDAGALVVESRPEDLSVAVERTGERHLRLELDWTPRAGAGEGRLLLRIGDERVEVPVELGAGG